MRTLLAVLACAVFGAAQAQRYPSKPIRLVVPYAAGGTSDILARQLGPKITEAWGQPVVIENKTGANGNVGADFVAKSAPDGYTLLLTDVGGLVISASVYPQLPFNPAKDFAPVLMVSYSPHVLAVHPSVKAGNVKEHVGRIRHHHHRCEILRRIERQLGIDARADDQAAEDRKSTRLNSSHRT